MPKYCMEYTYTTQLFVIYLKFTLNCTSCIYLYLLNLALSTK